MGFREIGKRTLRHHKRSKFLEDLSPRRWHEPVSHSRHLGQVIVFVISKDKGVQTVRARHVSADDKLLPAIQSVFFPSACTLSVCVLAVFTFSDYPLKTLLAYRGEQVCG